MDEEEKKVLDASEQEDSDVQSQAITRRQFLIGSGVGAVVGAAGAAGVIAVTASPRTASEVKVAQPGAAPIAQAEEVEEKLITLQVNGRSYRVLAKARSTLADVLRYQLGLTGAHIGCNHGECGTCTVVMDGKDIYSCTTMALAAEGHEIVTIEGLAKNTSSLEGLHPIQRAFVNNYAGQCTFCVPGQIMSAFAFLQANKNPTEEEIRQNLSGNICRCGSYQNVVRAVLAAAKEMRG